MQVEVTGHKEVSKFIDWAADREFADFSVWGGAHNAPVLDGDGKGGNKMRFLNRESASFKHFEQCKPDRNANHESAVPPTYRSDCGLFCAFSRLSSAAALLFPRGSGPFPL